MRSLLLQFARLAFCILALSCASTAQSKVIYVSPSGNNGDGLSWATAKQTPGAAISIAEAGDQIWVAATTYTSTHITIPAGVRLYGGFTGSETSWDQKNPVLHSTILDGGGTGVVVMFGPTADSGSRLDGFVVQNGANGIRVDRSSPTIVNNRITGCVGQYTAGMVVDNSAWIEVTTNRFDNNRVTDPQFGNGAGLSIFNCAAARVAQNSFENNKAAQRAGGLFVANCPALTVTDNDFINNSAGVHGGAINLNGSRATVNFNRLSGNACTRAGGAILVDGASPSVDFHSNTFTANTAGGAGVGTGGAVYLNTAAYSMDEDKFIDNQSTAWGGAVVLVNSTGPLFRCEFQNNRSDWGGALFTSGGSMELTSSEFIGNTAFKQGGGASINGPARLLIAGSLFWKNSAHEWNCALVIASPVIDANWQSNFRVVNSTFIANNQVNAGGGPACGVWNGAVVFANNVYAFQNVTGIFSNTDGVALVPNSVLYQNAFFGNTSDYGTPNHAGLVTDITGSISGDPRFVDVARGDFRLGAGSALLDAGDNTFVPADLLNDLGGNPRILDGTVDIGAYEGAVDAAPPVTSVSLSPHAGWNNSTVTVTLSATDDLSGVAATYYRLGGGPATAYTAPFQVSAEGGHTLLYWSVDRAGHTESARTTIVQIDLTSPSPNSLSVSTHTNTAATITLAASDSLSGVAGITVATQPAHGTLSGALPILTYTPDALYNGPDSFTFTVTDYAGNQSTGTVDIVVYNNAPVANPDSAITAKSMSVLINASANDTDADNDPLTVTTVSQPSHGSVTINTDNRLTYVPTAGYIGPDAFTYTVSDGLGGTATGTVTIEVTNSSQGGNPPVAVADTVSTSNHTSLVADVLANDSGAGAVVLLSITQPSNGTAVIANGNVHYTPSGAFAGTDKFDYTITDDNGGVATATVTVSVAANKSPAAVTDSSSVVGGNVVAINVLANDSDPEGDAMTITGFTQPASGGSVALNADGTFSFSSTAGFKGKATFTYTVEDGYGGSAIGTVAVAVSTSSTPIANNDSITVARNAVSVPIDVLANDSDPNGYELIITAVTAPSAGSVSISPDGKRLLFNAPATKGKLRFEYTVSSLGGTARAIATVTVP